MLTVLRVVFAYEMPRSPKNFWRYMGFLMAGGLWVMYVLWDTYPWWQGFLLGYLITRVLCAILQHTPLAKAELLE